MLLGINHKMPRVDVLWVGLAEQMELAGILSWTDKWRGRRNTGLDKVEVAIPQPTLLGCAINVIQYMPSR